MYTLMVYAFRGEYPFNLVDAPFSYRLLAPFLASVLPFSPEMSFGILNTFFCIMISLTVFWTCKTLEIDDDSSFKTSIAIIVSWNLLLYGTAVHIDAGFVMCWSIFILAIIRKERFAVLLTISIISVLFKEVALVMSLTMMFESRIRGAIMFTVQSTMIVIIRIIMSVGTPFQGTIGYLWWIDIARNLHVAAFTEILFSLGFIMPFAYYGFVHCATTNTTRFIFPAFLIALFGFLYGAFCGRFVWMLQVSLAPLFGKGLNYATTNQQKASVPCVPSPQIEENPCSSELLER
ncbi:MAG: hypothetical protein ACFE7R_11985, partial [Candidatus Hodarchaeota archaeon]